MQATTDRSIYDFPVALRPVYDERQNEIPKFKSVTRMDTHKPLAIVSDRYRLIPHRRMVEAFEPFGAGLGEHTTNFYQEKNGARVVVEQTFRGVTFRVPAHRVPGENRPRVGDVVALRTYGINSYNTTTPLTLRVGCLVLRCSNGATAMEGFFGLNIKHIGREEPEINLPTPESVVAAFQDTGRIWEQWADTRLSAEDVNAIVDESEHYGIASRRAIKDNLDRFRCAETVWDIYNAFTYVITHQSRRLQESSRLSRFDRLNMMINSWIAGRKEI